MMNDSLNGKVALGTWAWGDNGQPGNGWFGSTLDAAALDEVADKARAAGLTLWDTAVVYGMGQSEIALGKVLSRFDRSSYQLSTKFTPQVAGARTDAVADMLEASLERLGSDYIDLYWIHNPADVSRWTAHLIPLLDSGKVRHVGVSNHNLEQLQLADSILGSAGYRVEAAQNHFSLLYRASEKAGILDHCREQGIDFYAYMVLEQGALSGRYGPERPLPEGSTRAETYNGILPQLQALTDGLAQAGAQHDASTAEVAIAWAIGKGAIPIIGVTRPEQVDGLIRAAGLVLSDAEVAHLEALADAAGVDTRGSWEQEM